jgi:hypothetical protein
MPDSPAKQTSSSRKIATGEAQVARYTSSACWRTPKRNPPRNRGFPVTPFFKPTLGETSHGCHKNWKTSSTNGHGHLLTYCFFLTASLRLIPFYRIVELVIIDLLVSRFRVWCIVALAAASFLWPWHMLTSSCSRSPRTTAYTFFFFSTFLSTKMTALLAVFSTVIVSNGRASVIQHIMSFIWASVINHDITKVMGQ